MVGCGLRPAKVEGCWNQVENVLNIRLRLCSPVRQHFEAVAFASSTHGITVGVITGTRRFRPLSVRVGVCR